MQNQSNDNQWGGVTAEVEAVPSLFTDFDIHLLKEGRHYHLHRKLGAHPFQHNGVAGTCFALWGPNARRVSVVGDFNGWNRDEHLMAPRTDGSGIWEAFIPDVPTGTRYKYFIISNNGYQVEKGDPYGYLWETAPRTATVTWNLDYQWNDQEWMAQRAKKNAKDQPYSVYEVHLGSWRRVPEEEGRFMTYRELAAELPSYLKYMGFTHVEFMPVTEHPFYGSWGYQVIGYFAPSSRYGTPQDFMYLIDTLHREGIGVILDWVPSHFPSDEHGLVYFDGTHLYEHADPRKGYHPDWNSYIFNYGRNEVKSFLISSAVFWLEIYHIDALRVDAVASMLYLDYSRKHDEWIPNEYGGRENLEAIAFIKEFNEAVHAEFPDIQTIAEESTSWPLVTKPVFAGGLGFDMKWMMGWMNDTLRFFHDDPVYRKYHTNLITFSIFYAFSENFMLPLSHDEVVYGKGSLINKMPGDEWQKFANLRLLYGYMFAHPGAKLIFMGGDFAQYREWNHDNSLDWDLANGPNSKGIQLVLKHLNELYTSEAALNETQFDGAGFEWIDVHDTENTVMSFLRKNKEGNEMIIAVCNFTPTPRDNYRVGVPQRGYWKEIFNSDNLMYGGSDVKNEVPKRTHPIPYHNRRWSINLTLPPLGVVYYKFIGKHETPGNGVH